MRKQATQSFIWLGLAMLLLSMGCTASVEEASEPPMDAMVEVSEPPQPINMREVQEKIGYPAEAKEQGIEGMVVARILVGEEGQYLRHEWVQNEEPLLAEAVDAHLGEMVFEPATNEGQPVKFWVNVPFRFKLLK